MTWSRRLLKTNAKKTVRQNYWRSIAVCFLVALIGGTSLTTTQLLGQNQMEEVQRLSHVVYSYISTQGLLRGCFMMMLRALGSARIMASIGLLFITAVLWVLYKIFVSNMIRVGADRFFMETRVYPKTNISKIGYLYKGRDIKGPAWIMLCMYVHRFLWWFTIVGGIIKTFEYAMIPFIVAENPDISKNDAFELSKEMMRGNKWRLFVLHLSFLPWNLLGIVTMGLVNIFYLDAYRAAADAEFYMLLRRGFVNQRNKYSKFFVDNYLENKPSEDEILINMFVTEKDYTPSLESEEFSQKIYPMFLRDKESKWYEPPFKREMDRHYHLTTYIMVFFLTSVVGWIMELTMGVVEQGIVLNGSLMFGPWLPIVGAASIIILLIGRKIEKHPLVNVLFITVFASVVQYFYVWFLETVRGVRYWDFTNYLLNINGRICLASAVVLGAFGSFLFYLVGPALDDFLKEFPARKKWKWCLVLSALFLIDVAASIYFLFFQ